MAAAGPILLWANDPTDLQQTLQQARYPVQPQPVPPADAIDAGGCALMIIDATGWEADAIPFCRRVCRARVEALPPVLFLGGPEPEADAWLVRPWTERELLGQVQALLRLRQLQGKLLSRASELQALNDQLRQSYRQSDNDRVLAGFFQRQLQPRLLEPVHRLACAVHHRGRGLPGGDCWDLWRLPDGCAAFFLADVLGQGVSASLVALFLRGLLAAGAAAHPEDALTRLNAHLMALAHADPPLIALAAGALEPSGELRWARAGLPPPLYLPAGGPGRIWTVPGGLLGVGPGAFPGQQTRLRPGDRLLLTTDGLDVLGPEGPRMADRLLLAALEHRPRPLSEWVARVAADLQPHSNPEDDWTLLGLEMRGC